MSLIEFILLAASSLFVIIDPLALVPLFLAMTPQDTPQQRMKMARLACTVAAVVLVLFGLAGRWIFQFLGVTLPAFQMAGCIILLLIALDMLRAERSRVRESDEDTEDGVAKQDIAITPLAVPMLAGPGAISTTILLQSKATGIAQHVALYAVILGVCLASYQILRLSAHGAKWLNPLFMRVATRLMGLLLAAIAFQFLLNALADVGLVKPPQ